MTTHAADFGVGVKAYNRGDYTTALRISRQFADQGDTAAQNNLGVMCENGQGVTQNYVQRICGTTSPQRKLELSMMQGRAVISSSKR